MAEENLDALVKEQEELAKELANEQAEAKASQDEAAKQAKVDALAKEEARLQEAIRAAREEKRKKDMTFEEKFRTEQFEKAKTKFYSDYKYSDPEAQKKVLEVLTKVGSGSVDADNVYKDLEAAHLLLNKDKYINLEREVSRSEAAAAAYAADASGSGFSGAGDSQRQEQVDLSPDDVRAANWAHIPLEKYRELKSKGKL